MLIMAIFMMSAADPDLGLGVDRRSFRERADIKVLSVDIWQVAAAVHDGFRVALFSGVFNSPVHVAWMLWVLVKVFVDEFGLLAEMSRFLERP